MTEAKKHSRCLSYCDPAKRVVCVCVCACVCVRACTLLSPGMPETAEREGTDPSPGTCRQHLSWCSSGIGVHLHGCIF